MTENFTRGIIGDSFVTEIILTAVAKQIGEDTSDVYIYCKSDERRKYFREQYNVNAVVDADEFLSNVKVLVLAFSADDNFANELENFSEKIPHDTLIISYVNGMKISALEKIFPNHAIIRAVMSPMIVSGAGIGAYVVGSVSSVDSESLAQFVMSQLGKVIKVSSEDEFEKVAKLILGGTFYISTAINALTESGINNGLSVEKSQTIVAEVVRGILKTLTSSDDVIKYLIKQAEGEKEAFKVGKKILEEYGIISTLRKAFDSADVKEIFKFRYHYWK